MNAPNYFTAITEGWAAYAEYQLYPMDTKLYTTDKSSEKENKEILRQKYGMLYYQVILEQVCLSRVTGITSSVDIFLGSSRNLTLSQKKIARRGHQASA